MAHLTAVERETIITMNDMDKTVSITTHQKPVHSKLMKLVENGNATLVEDLTWGKQAGGTFELPRNMVTIRNPRIKVLNTKGQKVSKRAKPQANKCTHVKDNGVKCEMVAIKGTEKCRWHKDK